MTSGPAVAAPNPPGCADPRREHGWRGPRVLLGTVLGVLSAGLAYVCLVSGELGAPGNLSVAVAVLLLVPSSSDLGRRVTINGAVLIGWTQVLWWVRWPVPVNHGVLVVSALGGILVGLVVGAAEHRRALARLRPRVAREHLLIPLGAALALATMARWAFPGSTRQALVAMMPGPDNYPHFHMFGTLRTYGALTRAVGSAGDGSGWSHDNYPQGFHALAASISEVLSPAWDPGPGGIILYTQAVSAVVVLGVVVLTAAVVSVPGVRLRPALVLPAVVVTWAAYLWEPGQNVLADGFPNFWLAAASVATALLVSLTGSRRLGLPEVAATAGLLLGVAHFWAPLALVAAPAVLALLHPARSTLTDRRLRSRLWVALGVLVVAGLGVLRALWQLVTDIDVETLVTAWGGLHGTNPLPTLVLLVLGVYACAVAPLVVRSHGGGAAVQEAAGRARVLVLAPMAGVLLGLLLLAAQLRTVGNPSYYFLKLVIGLELVLAGFVPAVLVLLAVLALPRPRRRGTGPAVTVVASLLAAQAFGGFPRPPLPLFAPDESGLGAFGGIYSADRAAQGVLSAVAVSTRGHSFRRDYLAVGWDGAAEAFYPDAWYHSVLVSMTADARLRLDVLRRHVDDLGQAVPASRTLLEQDPGLELVVAPDIAPDLRVRLGPTLGRRVVTWR